jgi:murein DD-endopeptidase MepM/ murein hydrolase activator NlpD
MPFPLPFIPIASYKAGGRRFGADRADGRKHAGCDLIAPKGTEIYAVADGRILHPPHYFYRGTWAFSVNHFGYVVRYCEVAPPSAAELARLTPGAHVTAGEVIARVGRMHVDSMLHFEVYAGTMHGDLTVRANTPFQRRADLLNPSDLLDRLRGAVRMSNQPVNLSMSLAPR